MAATGSDRKKSSMRPTHMAKIASPAGSNREGSSAVTPRDQKSTLDAALLKYQDFSAFLPDNNFILKRFQIAAINQRETIAFSLLTELLSTEKTYVARQDVDPKVSATASDYNKKAIAVLKELGVDSEDERKRSIEIVQTIEDDRINILKDAREKAEAAYRTRAELARQHVANAEAKLAKDGVPSPISIAPTKASELKDDNYYINKAIEIHIKNADIKIQDQIQQKRANHKILSPAEIERKYKEKQIQAREFGNQQAYAHQLANRVMDLAVKIEAVEAVLVNGDWIKLHKKSKPAIREILLRIFLDKKLDEKPNGRLEAILNEFKQSPDVKTTDAQTQESLTKALNVAIAKKRILPGILTNGDFYGRLMEFYELFSKAQYSITRQADSEVQYAARAHAISDKTAQLKKQASELQLRDPFEKINSTFKTYEENLDRHKKHIFPTILSRVSGEKIAPLKTSLFEIKERNLRISSNECIKAISTFQNKEFTVDLIKARLEKASVKQKIYRKTKIIDEMKKRRDALRHQYNALTTNFEKELNNEKDSKIFALRNDKDTTDYKSFYESLGDLPDCKFVIAEINAAKALKTPKDIVFKASEPLQKINEAAKKLRDDQETLELELKHDRTALERITFTLLKPAIEKLVTVTKSLSIFSGTSGEEKSIATQIKSNLDSMNTFKSTNQTNQMVVEGNTEIAKALTGIAKDLQITINEKMLSIESMRVYHEVLNALQKQQAEGKGDLKKDDDIFEIATQTTADRLSVVLKTEIAKHETELAKLNKDTIDLLQKQAKFLFDTDWKTELDNFNTDVKNYQTELFNTRISASVKSEGADSKAEPKSLVEHLDSYSNKWIEDYVSGIFHTVNKKEAEEKAKKAADTERDARIKLEELQTKAKAELDKGIRNISTEHNVETKTRDANAAAANAARRASELKEIRTADQSNWPSGRAIGAFFAGLFVLPAMIYGGYLKVKQRTHGSTGIGAALSFFYGLVTLPFAWWRGVWRLYDGNTKKYDHRPDKAILSATELQAMDAPKPAFGCGSTAPISMIAGAGLNTSNIQQLFPSPSPTLVPPEWRPKHFNCDIDGLNGTKTYKNADKPWILVESRNEKGQCQFTLKLVVLDKTIQLDTPASNLIKKILQVLDNQNRADDLEIGFDHYPARSGFFTIKAGLTEYYINPKATDKGGLVSQFGKDGSFNQQSTKKTENVEGMFPIPKRPSPTVSMFGSTATPSTSSGVDNPPALPGAVSTPTQSSSPDLKF